MIDLRALTLIRPMAAAIVHGTKRIENRPLDLPKAMRGVPTIVAVHGGKGWDKDYLATVCEIDGGLTGGDSGDPTCPGYWPRLHDQGLVGLMLLTGRVFVHEDVDVSMGQPRDNNDTNIIRRFEVIEGDGVDFMSRSRVPSPSPWYSGPRGYEICDAIAFKEPIPCKGMLGFWRVPPEITHSDPVIAVYETLDRIRAARLLHASRGAA